MLCFLFFSESSSTNQHCLGLCTCSDHQIEYIHDTSISSDGGPARFPHHGSVSSTMIPTTRHVLLAPTYWVVVNAFMRILT